MKKCIFLITVIYSFTFSQNFWSETNGPAGGEVSSFSFNNDYVFAGFLGINLGPTHKGHSLYRAADSGFIWESLQLPSNKAITSIAFDTSGIMYIFIYGDGVLKSIDNGNSWLNSSVGINSSASATGYIKICKNNTLILGAYDGVYISNNGGGNWIKTSLNNWGNTYIFIDNYDNIFAYLQNNGLYKSTDYGQTWVSANIGLGDSRIESMEFNGRIFYAGTNEGLFKSINYGLSWKLLPQSPKFINSLAITSNNLLYAGTSLNGILVSKDQGETWQESNHGLESSYITSLKLLPTGDILAGVYGDGIFINKYGQNNWEPINEGIKSNTITSFLNLNENIFAGSKYGKIYKSSDEGNSWQKLPMNLTNKPIVALAKTKKNTILASSNYSSFVLESLLDSNYLKKQQKFNGFADVIRSTNEGISWEKVSENYFYNIECYYDSASGIEYIYATGLSGIYYSIDDGITWQPISVSPPDNSTEIKINSLGYLFTSSNQRIYKSTDRGNSWEMIYQAQSDVYHIVIDIALNDFIYAGMDWGKVICSTDNGNSWIDKGGNLPIIRVNSIATDNLNIVYVGNWNGEIFQSFDNGNNWLNIKSGSIGGIIFNLFCDDIGNTYLGPINGNVHKGANNLFSPPPPSFLLPLPNAQSQPLIIDFVWNNSPFANKYRLQLSKDPSFNTQDLILDEIIVDTVFTSDSLKPNTYYYWRVLSINNYGTSQYSDFRRFHTLTPITSVDNEIYDFSFSLSQNYPNPFNPTTKIKFAIPEFGFANLKIFNVLGKEIITLVNEEKQPGEYEIDFDASNLSSGVYFYQLKTGSFIQTNKMILMR